MPLKPNRFNTPTAWVRAIAETLKEHGLDVERMFSEIGMDYSYLESHDEYYLQDDITRLWALAVDMSKDPMIGLKVGTQIHTTSFPAIIYSLMSCKNLHESCLRLIRYQQLLSDGFRFEFQKNDDHYRLSFDISPCQLSPSDQAMDATLVNFLTFVRWVRGEKVSPMKLMLKRAKPIDNHDFEDLFNCPITFHAKHNYLFFSIHDMEFPLPSADEAISQIHDAKVNQILKQANKGEYSTKVRNKLIEYLPSGEPKQELIALELNMSGSTLKRRLSAEDTSFKTILDHVREKLAEGYLETGEHSLTEITYLLGFSENSAFNRAFKRWKGITPKQWKNN